MVTKPTSDELEQRLKECFDLLCRTQEELSKEAEKRRLLEEEMQQLRVELDERIMMTDVLHENEQQFRALVANIPGAVYRLRIGSEWTIEFISDVIEDITAYPASHFRWNRVETYRDIIHPEDRDKVEKAIGEGMDPLKSFAVAYRIIDANGQVRYFIEKGQAVYSGEGTPLWLDGTIFDDTERRQAEEAFAAAQKELIERAHQAGMADIATGTLHNVGNILNSVKSSSQVIHDIMEASIISDLKRANSLLKENMDDIEGFISGNPKGKRLMQYYLKLEDEFVKEHKRIFEHIERLTDKVKAIEDVIVAQQSYAGTSSLTELLDLKDIVEDALTMQSETIQLHVMTVEKSFEPVPKVEVQKSKLVHILINLIRNAKDAMIETPTDRRRLTFMIHANDEAVFLKARDAGQGISRQNIEKIFSHGFTTRKDGHGYGLHSSANYMTEMGGRMWAESEGPGKGATFILRFPHTDVQAN